jgi:hypothetical protein
MILLLATSPSPFAGWSRSDHRKDYWDCKSQVGETGLARDHSVSTALCEAIHMQATGRALTTAHENAAVGILVVQARCLGTLPRKVPEASARLEPFPFRLNRNGALAAKFDPPLHQNRSNISARIRKRVGECGSVTPACGIAGWLRFGPITNGGGSMRKPNTNMMKL